MKVIQVSLTRDKECRGSVRFATKDKEAPVTNLYISRKVPEVNNAETVQVSIQLLNGHAQ